MTGRPRSGRPPVTAAPGRSPAGQRGFTLVETLVSLLVLSVGMLGIAALHTRGLGAGRTAHYRNQAVNLVADMAERIRVNRLGLGVYGGAAADNRCDPAAGGGVDCTPAQMAAHDLHLWDREVRDLLPDGEWRIQVDPGAAPPSYRLEVSWEEIGRGPGSAPTLHTGPADMSGGRR